MIILCDWCGAEFDRDAPYIRKQNYCCYQCYRAAARLRERKRYRKQTAKNPKSDPCGSTYELRDIIVTKPLSGVFPELQPELGRRYRARHYLAANQRGACWALEIGGKIVIVRPGEFEEVGA